MGVSRLASVPFDHVVAEIAAFPLASEAAFRLNVLELDPNLHRPTDLLWREAEKALRLPALSLEELLAVRDLLWFSDLRTVPLGDYLQRLAQRFLSFGGQGLRPKLEEGGGSGTALPAKARRFWRWLTFALPPDLLAVGFMASQGSSPDLPVLPEVTVLSPTLEKLLQSCGYAQLHLHFGASVEFADLWAGAMWLLNPKASIWGASTPSDLTKLFQSPGADFHEGRDLGPWLLRGAVVRFLLAWYLGSAPSSDFKGFLRSVDRHLSLDLRKVLRSVLADIERPYRYSASRRKVSDKEIRTLYAALLRAIYGYQRAVNPHRLNGVHELRKLDPISTFFPSSLAGSRRLTAEACFVHGALRYLQGGGANDKEFLRCFWQVVRLRNLFYRHMVLRPLTPGLQWFIRFFARIRPARVWGPRLLVERAFLQDGVRPAGHPQPGLRSLEVRTSPEDSSQLRGLVQELEKGWRTFLHPNAEGPEFGLVLHFPKDRGGNFREGKFPGGWGGSAADPRCHAHRYRYGTLYLELKRQADALVSILRSYPYTLLLIRGIDVCGDELGVSTWVFVPLFRYLREVSRWVAGHLQKHRNLDVPPLRATVHVGEDFLHLMGGLRRIDEAIRYLRLEEGDRLGHALALGVDPEEWAKRAGRLPLPREERLWDLVWEWSLYVQNEANKADAQRLAYLEGEISRISREIFGRGHSVQELLALMVNLHSEEMLKKAGFPRGGSPGTGDPELELLQKYLTDERVFDRGRVPIWVDPLEEIETLSNLQNALRHKVARQGLIIEVNPTSNLLIGDLADLSRHPLWRLLPPKGGAELPALSLGVGSDDPLTMATTLPLEYQLLVDALTLSGLSQEEAERWLRRVLEDGLKARFTLPIGVCANVFKGTPQGRGSRSRRQRGSFLVRNRIECYPVDPPPS